MKRNNSTHSISVLRKELTRIQARSQEVHQDREKRREEFIRIDWGYQRELDLIEQEIEELLDSIKTLQLKPPASTEDWKRSTPSTPDNRKFNKED